MSKPRVAIVADWLIGGGGERVVEALHQLYPEAPIYASYASPEWQTKLDGQVVTGYLQRWPFAKLRKYIGWLRIGWYKRLDLRKYDIVISCTGNGEAKHIRTPQGTTHICYCFTPVHYYWRHYHEYLAHPGFALFNPLARLGLRLMVNPLKKRDLAAAKKVDHFIAISKHIRDDIQTYYNRDSSIIHPPVQLERFAASTPHKRHGFVTVGRLVPYKKVDLIIQACNQLHAPLTVVGRGPEESRLRSMAGPTVTFDTAADDTKVARYLAGAQAFLFCAYEDFGVAPVEAMAAGTPVVAYQSGGTLDYIVPGKTGVFFANQTVEDLIEAIQTVQEKDFTPSTIQKHAAAFSVPHFRTAIEQFVNDTHQ